MTKSLNQVDATYYRLLQDIMANGVEKGDRTGTGTVSVFGRQVSFDCRNGKIPLLTTKKMYTRGIVSELLWFLNGRTDLRYLLENNCHIWVGDAYKAYQGKQLKSFPAEPDSNLSKEEFINKIKTDDEFSKKWGDLGPIYGKQWRNWENFFYDDPNPDRGGFRYQTVDQIQNLINDLKTNPDSRRLMVTAWHPSQLDQMVLPPCHYGFQVYTRELSFDERWSLHSNKPYDGNPLAISNTLDYLDDKNVPSRAISLMWNQRSVDTPLGLPFNIASYGILLHLIGKIVNMIPEDLIGNLGDTHIYQNQLKGVKEQLKRGSACEVPTLKINDEFWLTETQECGTGKLSQNLDSLLKSINVEDFIIENYVSHEKIDFPLSN